MHSQHSLGITENHLNNHLMALFVHNLLHLNAFRHCKNEALKYVRNRNEENLWRNSTWTGSCSGGEHVSRGVWCGEAWECISQENCAERIELKLYMCRVDGFHLILKGKPFKPFIPEHELRNTFLIRTISNHMNAFCIRIELEANALWFLHMWHSTKPSTI